MAMWPRVDLELVEDFAALSPWGSRWLLRIHTDVPLDERTAPMVKAAMDAGKPTGDFTPVLAILSGMAPVASALRENKTETQRTWAMLTAALTPPPGELREQSKPSKQG
jgi:hypothetical protein